MAQLHQINIGFDPVEDRLLLKVRGDDESEIRLWLTRRYVKLLWSVLQQALKTLSGAVEQTTVEAQRAVMDFHQEQALAKSDFSTPWDDSATHTPLGEAPILVTQIQRRTAPGREMLRLSPADGPGIEIGCNPDTLHSISVAVADAARKAEWDLTFEASPETGIATPPAAVRH